MWDEEEINKKIKDAADQYHPAYDDNAWDKMEQLLDEHLPQKKERRRILYFLPLFLLLGGGLFFIISRNGKTPSSKVSEKNILKNNIEKIQQRNSFLPQEAAANSPSSLPGKKVVTNEKSLNEKPAETPINTATPAKKRPAKILAANAVTENENTGRNTHTVYRKNTGIEKNNKIISLELNAKRDSGIENNIVENFQSPQNQKTIRENITADNNDAGKTNTAIVTASAKDTLKNTNVTKTENVNATHSQKKQDKINKSFARNFGISISAGPDVSGVKLSNAGKLTLAYGAGLSYSLSKKFTLHTGFYIARKIYSVGEDEYHVQPGGPGNNNYLQSVDANCKVYEIPLTVSYNFKKIRNHNWFASAGLSSYFMKKESYVYFYKNSSGNTYTRSWAIANQNKHYFSILDLSAGYEYAINKQFSITAEPYIKLPLSGIGLGKVKLSSAGILFTVSMKPFYKK